MRRVRMFVLCALMTAIVIGFSSGCATHSLSYNDSMPMGYNQPPGTPVIPSNRILIKAASLKLETDDVKDALAKAESIVKQKGGYIESSNLNGEKNANLSVRIPAAKLEETINLIGDAGNEISRYVSAEDVTDTVIDLEARMKNKKALRDRLRALLERAGGIKDVLYVEKEMARLQAEIDSMEGMLKSYKSRATMSQLSVRIGQKRILGPVSYVFKGLGWCVEKLFIIR